MNSGSDVVIVPYKSLNPVVNIQTSKYGRGLQRRRLRVETLVLLRHSCSRVVERVSVSVRNSQGRLSNSAGRKNKLLVIKE